jgi:predicted nucleic acid-binding protein
MSELPRLYVESHPLIDLVKVNVGLPPKTGAEKDAWYLERILEAARAGEVELFTSTLTIAECTHVSDPTKLEMAKPIFLGLLASGKSGIRLVQTTLSVVERARDLRWFSSLKLSGADAIHVASALHLRCDELLTGEGKILQSAPLLAPMSLCACAPSATILLPPKYLQDNLEFESGAA